MSYILVFNSGSSSLKFKLFEVDDTSPTVLLGGMIHNFGEQAEFEWSLAENHTCMSISATDHASAAQSVFDLLEKNTYKTETFEKRYCRIGRFLQHPVVKRQPTDFAVDIFF